MMKTEKSYREGSIVYWKATEKICSGTIESVHIDFGKIKVDGAEFAIVGTSQNPAYVIRTTTGDPVIKQHAEVSSL